MDRISTLANIKEAEGFRNVVYDDATGKPLRPGDTLIGHASIGWGTNLHEPQPTSALEIMLETKFDATCADLNAHVPGWRSWPHQVGNALAEMAYNLGWPRLSGFHDMLAACRAGDWRKAAAECLDSDWARQVKGRALRIAGQFRAAGE